MIIRRSPKIKRKIVYGYRKGESLQASWNRRIRNMLYVFIFRLIEFFNQKGGFWKLLISLDNLYFTKIADMPKKHRYLENLKSNDRMI
jgi:hypothetical protein